MKVGHVTERTDASSASSFLDSDELERTGIDLGTTGRLQLMARLAEGAFFLVIRGKLGMVMRKVTMWTSKWKMISYFGVDVLLGQHLFVVDGEFLALKF